MMKFYTLLRYLIIVTVITAMGGCNLTDLDENPLSQIKPGQFYKDVAAAEAGLNGVYQVPLSSKKGYQKSHWIITDLPSDDQIYDAGGSRGQIDQMRGGPTNGNFEDFWRGNWEGINRANQVINRVSKMKNIDKKNQTRIIEEARFLRAFMYFHLVRLFGDIPIKTEETLTIESANTGPRIDAKQVYEEVIIPDLKAAENLPKTPNLPGRATSGAAKTLLAKVYLTMAGKPISDQSKYQLALSKTKEVMNMGVYDLFSNYADVFNVNTENGVEHIFTQQFKGGNDFYDNNIAQFFLPSFGNWGYGTFAHTHPTMGLVNAYSANDKRFAVNILQEVPVEGGEFRKLYPRSGKLDNVWIGKYMEPKSPIGNTNVPFLRYAEVLLMRAELENEVNGGPTKAAYSAINRVRVRAGLDPLTQKMDKHEFFEAIIKERRLEFPFERKRRYDLIRWGRFVDTMKAFAKKDPFVFNWSAGDVTKTDLLLPIPQNAIDQNSDIGPDDQNPGY